MNRSIAICPEYAQLYLSPACQPICHMWLVVITGWIILWHVSKGANFGWGQVSCAVSLLFSFRESEREKVRGGEDGSGKGSEGCPIHKVVSF